MCGVNKALSIAHSIAAYSSLCDVRVFPEFLSAANFGSVMSDFDVVLDCTGGRPGCTVGRLSRCQTPLSLDT